MAIPFKTFFLLRIRTYLKKQIYFLLFLYACMQDKMADISRYYCYINFLIRPLFYVITVLELSAEIATLQSVVLSTRQELREAIKDHHNLQSEATAMQSDQAAE